MRGAFSTVEMTLVLNVVGCVSPTESTADGSLLQCEGLNNQSYSCKSGHCCGEAKCCSHYYELWWFWLVWAIIFILCCCCIFHHRRTKHRLQQQQRQHEINLIAYREAHNYTAVPFYFRFLPNYLLPDYEEVVSRPLTPPPPYSALHTVSSTLPSGPLSRPQQAGHSPAVQSVPAAPDLDPLRPRAALEGADPASGVGFFLPDLDAKSLQAAQHSGSTITRSGGALDQGLAGEGRSGSEKWERGGAGDPDKGSALTDLGSCAKEKPLLPVGGRRRRRFTGDSGIEVCVCRRRGSGGAELGEGRELKELESLLGCTEDDEEEDEEEGKGDGCREFCESCSPCAHLSEDEEQNLEGPGRGGDRDRDPESVPALQISSCSSSSNSCDAPAMCALMHTVNELEGTQHGNVPEGWSP